MNFSSHNLILLPLYIRSCVQEIMHCQQSERLIFYVKADDDHIRSGFLDTSQHNTQCGKLRIFLPLRFYVKSTVVILKPQKLSFWLFQQVWILNFCNFLTFQSKKFSKKSKLEAPKKLKRQFLKLISPEIRVTEKLLNFHTWILFFEFQFTFCGYTFVASYKWLTFYLKGEYLGPAKLSKIVIWAISWVKQWPKFNQSWDLHYSKSMPLLLTTSTLLYG